MFLLMSVWSDYELCGLYELYVCYDFVVLILLFIGNDVYLGIVLESCIRYFMVFFWVKCWRYNFYFVNNINLWF